MPKNTAKKTAKTNTAKKTAKTPAPLDIIADVTTTHDNDTRTALAIAAFDRLSTPVIDTPVIDTPVIDTPVIDDSDVIFHNVAAAKPATVSAVIVPPVAAKPFKVRHNPRFGIALGLISGKIPEGNRMSNDDIRALITAIGETRHDVRRFFSKAEPRRIPKTTEIKPLRAHLIVIGEQLAPDDVETRKYLALIAGRLHDRLTVGESYSEDELSAVVARYDREDTLPASVPEFALAEQLAAQ